MENDELRRLANFFKILSDPTRVTIISLLAEKPLSVSEIVENLDISQSAVSHQLRLLKDFSFVTSTKNRQKVIYSLSDEHVLSIFMQANTHLTE